MERAGRATRPGCAAREAARESGDERVQSTFRNIQRCLDSARHDKRMTPTLYLVLGLLAGGLLAAIIFFLSKRGGANGTADSEAQTELIRRLEMLDRGLRDEFSRNREEGASVAKNQREELNKSIEGVRALVPLL